ncbi:MAG: hypothetical protein AAF757_12865 [Cyanobacteria bacterium P01_D01_bin.116]
MNQAKFDPQGLRDSFLLAELSRKNVEIAGFYTYESSLKIP